MGEANAAEKEWSLKLLEHILLDLDEADADRIDTFVAHRISAFNNSLLGAVARRVKLLEEENKQ